MLGLPTETEKTSPGISIWHRKSWTCFIIFRKAERQRRQRQPFLLRALFRSRLLRSSLNRRKPWKSGAASRRFAGYCEIQKSFRQISRQPHQLSGGGACRGDRRLCPVVEYAWRSGSKLDGWNDYFSMERWEDAEQVCGVDFHFYANRVRAFDEVMPWDHLDYG